jgi:hypothetical protein
MADEARDDEIGIPMTLPTSKRGIYLPNPRGRRMSPVPVYAAKGPMIDPATGLAFEEGEPEETGVLGQYASSAEQTPVASPDYPPPAQAPHPAAPQPAAAAPPAAAPPAAAQPAPATYVQGNVEANQAWAKAKSAELKQKYAGIETHTPAGIQLQDAVNELRDMAKYTTSDNQAASKEGYDEALEELFKEIQKAQPRQRNAPVAFQMKGPTALKNNQIWAEQIQDQLQRRYRDSDVPKVQ